MPLQLPCVQYQSLNKPMVKVYYTYSYSQTLGQCLSRGSNFLYDPQHKLFLAGVNQYIALLSPKTGEVEHYLARPGKNIPVRHLHLHAGKLYAGYEDGEVAVWGLGSRELLFGFDLHKATVSSIAVCEEESKLVTSGYDGHIMVWDLLSEQCQPIKSAHPSMITQVLTTSLLIRGRPTTVILSVGKDGFLRVWDLRTGLCLSALSCQVTEVYCMYLDPTRNVLYIGTNKEEIVIVGFNEEVDNSNRGTLCYIRGVFKKKSYARCTQMFVQHGVMYVFNADRTIESYRMLNQREIQLRKKRVISRKKNKGENAENVQQPEQAEIQLKFIEQKVVPFKFYNAFVHDSRIFLNNGTNIYQLSTSTEVTSGSGRTDQLSLQYPFLTQRSPTALHVYTSASLQKLFTIPLKAEWCQLFSNGYLMVVGSESVSIWDLAKNEQMHTLEEKWSGCWVKGNRCLLWRGNELGVYQVGYDKNKNIRMKQVDSRKFEDKIIEAAYKHNTDKYIVNLQNSQLLVNYSDTHKNFLKLYGHKMPVLAFDLSSDDALLATGSIDKDIRIWDMDFGQSIKSLFAHQQAVTTVKFVHDTHYLLSGSRDGHIKFWDMDTYQLIMDFEESTMEVRSLVVSNAGDFFVAGGLDEGLRVWKQSNEQTIAADMEEKQMEKVMIEDYAKEKLEQNEAKTRYEDLKHGEQIIEALENKETPKMLMSLLKKIPPGNLRSCLSFLHERHVRRLQQYLKLMIEGNYESDTCWRVIKQLNRGSELGRPMREVWKPLQKMVHTNVEVLKTLLKKIQEQNQMII